TAKAIFIGRSRKAEFGEIQINSQGITDAASPSIILGDNAMFLCVSDLALRDLKTGSVRLLPEVEDFGLPAEWLLDPLKTFLRTRRYSPFNAKRHRHDV